MNLPTIKIIRFFSQDDVTVSPDHKDYQAILDALVKTKKLIENNGNDYFSPMFANEGDELKEISVYLYNLVSSCNKLTLKEIR